ncbi:hypothetical protein HYW74_04345 [Candidatus Pacearchaeota archaeon]|nr:hypothetical protein [Candidatus Pacearchaeota archaeon]
MELVKGDWDNLEGKVMVYGKLNLSDNEDAPGIIKENGILMGTYASADSLDYVNFLKSLGAPEYLIDVINSAESQVKDAVKGMDMGKRIFMARGISGVPIECEEDLLFKDFDVLKIGEYFRLGNFLHATNLGVEYYMVRFEDQLIKKHGVESLINTVNRKPKDDQNKTESKQAITYKDIEPAKIGWYLFNTFVDPLLHMYRCGESEKTDLIAEDAINFSMGSLFMPQLLKILDLMKNGGAKLNEKLINCYVSEIDAILREDYETAARVRSEILAMKG